MTVIYTAHATSTRGRDGIVETDDKKLSLRLSDPSKDIGSNPEQLFACGYSACFGSALQSIAKSDKLEIGEVKVKAEISLNKDGDKGYFLGAKLDVILNEVDSKTAECLIRKTHQICPYSNATRGNIDVVLKYNGQLLSDWNCDDKLL